MGLAAFLSVFLFLGWQQAAFSFVEPPTNVTLDCRNMRNVLKWSYNRISPGLRFRVDIGTIHAEDGYPMKFWVNSPAQLQADVSFLSDPNNAYHLAITAVIGQNESDSEEGLSFSYFKDSPADQKCHLDFPSVNVTTQHDGSVRFRFVHPSLVYLQKLPSSRNKRKRKTRSNTLPLFNYYVTIHQKKGRHNFNCCENVCEKTISVDAAQKKHCLKMEGELEKISVQATQEYCVLPPEEAPSFLIPIYVVCSLSALCALGFILGMVYRKWTTPNSASPQSVMFPKSLRQVIPEVDQETCIVPEVEPTSPTPLLSAEENEFTQFVLPATEPELRLPIRVSTGVEGVCDDEEGTINGEPGYMPGRHLEEDEVPYSSGYEKRSVLVELAPDELAEGYRG